MTLEDIKTWLQGIVKAPAGCYFTGKIDSSKDNCIGIYDVEGPKPNLALGGLQNTGYGIKSVAFLIHWGKNSSTAEMKAQEVYDTLFGNPHNAVTGEQKVEYSGLTTCGEGYTAIIGGQRVIMFDMKSSAPIGLDTDDNGIYEYAIYVNIYYSRT